MTHNLFISWNVYVPPLHRKHNAVDNTLLFLFPLIIVCFSFDIDYSFRDILQICFGLQKAVTSHALLSFLAKPHCLAIN